MIYSSPYLKATLAAFISALMVYLLELTFRVTYILLVNHHIKKQAPSFQNQGLDLPPLLSVMKHLWKKITVTVVVPNSVIVIGMLVQSLHVFEVSLFILLSL